MFFIEINIRMFILNDMYKLGQILSDEFYTDC